MTDWMNLADRLSLHLLHLVDCPKGFHMTEDYEYSFHRMQLTVVFHTAVVCSTQIVEQPVRKLAGNFHENAVVDHSHTCIHIPNAHNPDEWALPVMDMDLNAHNLVVDLGSMAYNCS